MKRVLCIWLPNWPVQRLIVAQPELESQGLILHVRDSRRGQRVAYCHATAQRRGVHPGMSLAEVATLIQADTVGPPVRNDVRIPTGKGCKRQPPTPRLLLQEHDPRKDLQSLTRMAEWCEQFSPCVGLESSPHPASLLLDVSHSAAHWGGENRLLDQVAHLFYERGYRIVAAIADTLGTAWAVAHFSDLDTDFPWTVPWTWSSKTSDTSKTSDSSLMPRGFLVPVNQSVAALHRLPIESLRIDGKTINLLQQLGIRSIEQLLQLPRSGLQSRFDATLLLRIDQSLGKVAETFEACHLTAPLQTSLSLEHATANRQVLEKCLERLCTQLCEQLRQQERGAIRIECRLHLTNRTTITISLGLFRPSFETRHLGELLRMQLDQHSVQDTVHRIEMDITISARLEYRQHSLLGDVPQEMPQQLARLVDRLSSRLGQDTVLGAQLMAEPQIEHAFRYLPLTGQQATVGLSSSAARKRHQHGPGFRPIQVTGPQRLHTTGPFMPALSSRPPDTFGYQGHIYHTHRCWGPERIETGWWQGRLVRRDYYQVENKQGNRFWLFQDLSNGAWFLQGLF